VSVANDKVGGRRPFGKGIGSEGGKRLLTIDPGGDPSGDGVLALDTVDSADDPSLNGGVSHPGNFSGVGLSMNMPCFFTSCHNCSTTVQSGLEGVWSAMFIDNSSTGFTRFCNAAVPSSVTSTSMPPSSFSRAATGAPNTKSTTMKRIRRVRVTILCSRICVGLLGYMTQIG
jgi:hypothetical protein